MNGFESSLNIQLLPSFRHFGTYIGMGYFEGKTKYGNNNQTLTLSNPIFKVGAVLKFSKFSLFGEYKQSLSPAKINATNHVSVGIMF